VRGRWAAFLAAGLAVATLVGVLPAAAAPERYRATILRDRFGIPHITAPDWGSLGFGQGFAAAADHGCDLADQVVRVRSERARWLGPGEADTHLNSDLALLALGVRRRAERLYPKLSGRVREALNGYAAGYNAFLRRRGAGRFPGWCRGEPWVRPISPVDLLTVYVDLQLLASGRQLARFIPTARPPAAPSGAPVPGEPRTTPAGVAPGAAPSAGAPAVAPAVALGPPPAASNGWAIGRRRTAGADGLLLANPHFPWEGELRFWEVHLRIPGRLDVYGATLHGVMGVLIGFNRAVAWTHTVSAGHRFTLYRLDLDPADPTRYRYGEGWRTMRSRTYRVRVRGDDGRLRTEERTLWSSHYGPMLDLPGVGWSGTQAVTYRDANLDNEAFLDQFLAMDTARSLGEFRDAHRRHNGIPWVNTIAVGRDGRVWYADTAATPRLAQATIRRWLEALERDPFTKTVQENGAVLLDGSDPGNEWVEVAGARSPGLVPFREQPQLSRLDYVFNANDSYWLANPRRLLEGYSPMHGRERTPRTPRTRQNVVQLEEDGGADGRFTLGELQRSALSNRSLTAELLRAPLVETLCGDPGDLAAACEVLARWDGRFDRDSKGAALWRLFIEAYTPEELTRAGPLFRRDFDPDDPVGTPTGAAFGDPTHAARARAALTQAVADLAAAGHTPDVAYGVLHHAPRGGRRVGLHGGPGETLGITNVVAGGRLGATSEPLPPRPPPVREGGSLTREGWPVTYGTSFLLAVAFRDGRPRARALLTYGQSSDPASPHHDDQLGRFAAKRWRTVLFADRQLRDADGVSTLRVQAPRTRDG
jgi:acyl-homoserine-lactone acylase